MKLTVPLDASDEFEEPQEPVFQFKPDFHRVPSPIINTPLVTFIPPAATVEGSNKPSGQYRSVAPSVDPAVADDVFNSVPPPPPEAPPPSVGVGGKDKEETEGPHQKIADIRASTVSARAKFFEQEIQQLSTGSKTDAGGQGQPKKQFSFLSQYEVDRMKQEEERKIAAVGGSMDILRTTELEQVVEEDEEFYLEEDEELNTGEGGNRGGSQGDISATSGLGDSTTRINTGSRTSSDKQHARSVSASSISSISSTGSIRTAKAERRLNEKMGKEGLGRAAVDPSGLGMDLSPSEQRALQAEKRAAWRKARLKSLEQVGSVQSCKTLILNLRTYFYL